MLLPSAAICPLFVTNLVVVLDADESAPCESAAGSSPTVAEVWIELLLLLLFPPIALLPPLQ